VVGGSTVVSARWQANAKSLAGRNRVRRRDVEDRGDDTDDVVRRRVQIYDAEAARVVVDAIADWADVVTLDGDQPVEAVKTEALEKLGARRDRAAICTSERVERR
jgi:adenylate kinase family enzyme